jgi:FecR-like protein
MKALRIGTVATLGALVVSGTLPAATAATPGTQLERLRGAVGYRASTGSPVRSVISRVDLADDAWAVTDAAAAALLRLADSSEIELGEKTVIQVGAFSGAQSGEQNTIVVERGALHVMLHDTASVRANYVVQTGTSQIALRATDAYVVAGPRGTQVFCVACAPGDVTIRTGARVVTIVTGEAATILGASPAAAAVSVGANATTHNPAVDQFAASRTSLAPNPAVVAVDPTGAVDGRPAPAGAGSAAGTIAAAAAVAAGVAVAAGASHGSGGASSSPPPAPTTVQFVTTTSSPTPAPAATQPPPAGAPVVLHPTAPAQTPGATPTPSPSPRARAVEPRPPNAPRGSRP